MEDICSIIDCCGNIDKICVYYLTVKNLWGLLKGDDGSVIRSFAWNAINGPLEAILDKKNKKKINIVGKIKKNEWMGKKNIEFIIEDASPI